MRLFNLLESAGPGFALQEDGRGRSRAAKVLLIAPFEYLPRAEKCRSTGGRIERAMQRESWHDDGT
jgi:hypothetical protein